MLKHLLRRVVVALVVALVGPVAAQAQTGVFVRADFQIYQPGVDPVLGAPFQTSTYAITATTCNQVAPAPDPVIVANPTRMIWNDPTNPGKVCIADQATFLAALPTIGSGSYLATMTQTDDFGTTTARSAPSNSFTRRPPPAAATGLRSTK